jgi:hypothetical protein
MKKIKVNPVTSRIVEAMYFIISTSQFKEITDQKTFAKAINTTEYRVSMYKAKGANPTIWDITNFLNAFPISAEWLWRGTGSMILRDQNDPVQAIEWVLGEMKRLRAEVNRSRHGTNHGTNAPKSGKKSASVKNRAMIVR